MLERALSLRRPGRYQLQAAIAALHVEEGETDWPQIAALYAELARLEPSPVVELNRAVAVAMAEGRSAASSCSTGSTCPGTTCCTRPAPTCCGGSSGDDAAAAYRAALALEMNDGDRAFLEAPPGRGDCLARGWYGRTMYRERLPQLDGGSSSRTAGSRRR